MKKDRKDRNDNSSENPMSFLIVKIDNIIERLGMLEKSLMKIETDVSWLKKITWFILSMIIASTIAFILKFLIGM